MNLSKQIATHFRQVFLGGNWTSSNVEETLSGITWLQATQSIYTLNSIASLTYHINYYVREVLKVLEGGTLDAHDKFSFDCPPVLSEKDWQDLKDTMLANAEKFAALIEALPEEKFAEVFAMEKYGNYYRNMHGIIEHTHYHLGQIALIKKILLQQESHSL